MSDEVEDFLAHYGVKGMKWGVRNDRSSSALAGVPGSTRREARKDAAESARAKMFYGEGAGTRRKLIKATVEQKSKRDPAYKKAYDHYLDSQDMSKHASRARGERKRKDTVSGTVKTAKGVHRSLTGGFGSVSLASAVLASGYVYAKQTGMDATLKNAFTTTVSNVRSQAQNRSSMNSAKQFLKDMGM